MFDTLRFKLIKLRKSSKIKNQVNSLSSSGIGAREFLYYGWGEREEEVKPLFLCFT